MKPLHSECRRALELTNRDRAQSAKMVLDRIEKNKPLRTKILTHLVDIGIQEVLSTEVCNERSRILQYTPPPTARDESYVRYLHHSAENYVFCHDGRTRLKDAKISQVLAEMNHCLGLESTWKNRAKWMKLIASDHHPNSKVSSLYTTQELQKMKDKAIPQKEQEEVA